MKNTCIHVDSLLPGGRRAGDIKVGDIIQLGDQSTPGLETRAGLVTHSSKARTRAFKMVTASGTRLLCSETAAIWTDEGFVLAPHLLGKNVATRVDNDDIVIRFFETVEVLAEIGTIDVQRITVGDRGFWAGANPGRFVLHLGQ
jgi:hypothetical protein